MRYISLLAAMIFAAAAARAQTVPEDKLASGPALSDLIIYALEKNPEITAAKEEWRAKVEGIRIAGGYPDPELMVEQMGFSDPEWSARLSFMLPFPGKLSAAANAAASDASVARIATDRAARDLAVMIRESAAEISYLQKALLTAKANGELLKRLNNLAENSYAASRSELIDLVKARSDMAKVSFDAEVLGDLLAVEKEKLNSLLSRPLSAPLGNIHVPAPPPLAYTAAEVGQMAARDPEEMKSASREVEKARYEAKMASLESYPDFTFAVFKNPISSGGEETYGFSAGLTLPLWLDKNRGRAAAAESMVKRAEAMRDAKRNSLLAEARELYFRVVNAERLVRLYAETLIPQARRSLELAETWVKGGEAGVSDYAEVLATLYGFELAEARARADQAKYLARLERYAGKSLTVREVAGKEGGK